MERIIIWAHSLAAQTNCEKTSIRGRVRKGGDVIWLDKNTAPYEIMTFSTSVLVKIYIIL